MSLKTAFNKAASWLKNSPNLQGTLIVAAVCAFMWGIAPVLRNFQNKKQLRENFNQMEQRQDSLSRQDSTSYAAYQNWLDGMNYARNTSFFQQANTANLYVNMHMTYEADSTLYGKNDYYAAPLESFINKKGDCEDYAIAKYAVLQHLDAPSSRYCIGLVAAEPKTQRKSYGVDHAVLIADTSAANDWSGCLLFEQGFIEGRTIPETGYKMVYYMNDNGVGTTLSSILPTTQKTPKTAPLVKIARTP